MTEPSPETRHDWPRVYRISRGWPWFGVGTGVFCPLLLIPYTWGSVRAANVLLDRSDPVTHRVEVLGKHVSSGRGPSHHLRLAAWGPGVEDAEHDVHPDLYAETEIGEHVCVRLHEGALGARRYVIVRCR